MNAPANLLAALVRTIRRTPTDDALWLSPNEPPLRWIDLATAAVHAADQFGKSSERLIYQTHGDWRDVMTALACMAAGRIESPIDPRQNHLAAVPVQLDRPTRLAGNDWNWAAVDRLQSVAEQIDPDSVALVLQTGGTTATPRGVPLTHGGLVANAAAKLAAVPQLRTDRRLSLLPMSHAYARTCDFGTWLIAGGQLAIARDLPGWGGYAATLINATPSLAERLLGDPDAANLRLLGCGGAAMDRGAFDRWRARGVAVIQGYGLTEAGPCVCSSTPADGIAGCVGRPVPGVQVRIVDAELWVRGPSVVASDDDGWLRTGDEARIDDAERVWIDGRGDDVIVLDNGYKIHPSRAEATIAKHCAASRIVLLRDGAGRVVVGYEPTADFDPDQLDAAIDQTLPISGLVNRLELIPPVGDLPGELSIKGVVRRAVISQRLKN